MPNLDPFPDVTADEFGAIAAAESTTPLRGRPFPLAPVLVRILAIVFDPIGRLSGFVRGDVDEASANVVVDDEEEDEEEEENNPPPEERKKKRAALAHLEAEMPKKGKGVPAVNTVWDVDSSPERRPRTKSQAAS